MDKETVDDAMNDDDVSEEPTFPKATDVRNALVRFLEKISILSVWKKYLVTGPFL